MPLIPARDLTRRTREVLDEVERTGKITIVTRQGRPAIALIPIDADDLEDFVLAGAQRYLSDMNEADKDLARGVTRSLGDLSGGSERSKPPAAGKGHRRRATARSSSRR